MHRISIIGVGRVGGALAIALSAKGFEITELVYRGEQKPDAVAARLSTMPEIVRFGVEHGSDADVVLVTTGDPDIAATAEWIRAVYKAPALVLHTSGSLSSEVLSNAAEPERIGSMHPLISISDSLRGADVELALALAAKLQVQPQFIRTSWPSLMQDYTAGRFDVALGGSAVSG